MFTSESSCLYSPCPKNASVFVVSQPCDLKNHFWQRTTSCYSGHDDWTVILDARSVWRPWVQKLGRAGSIFGARHASPNLCRSDVWLESLRGGLADGFLFGWSHCQPLRFHHFHSMGHGFFTSRMLETCWGQDCAVIIQIYPASNFSASKP